MIAGHTKQGHNHNALHFSKQMQQEGMLPNVATFISLLDACANEVSISCSGRQLHACFSGDKIEYDVVLGTALVNMYGKYGELGEAWRIFSQLPDRNTVSWNGMITAYSLHNQCRLALDLFDQMLQEGQMPDKFIFVTVLSAHATEEDLRDGRRMYSRLVGTGHVKDPVVQTGVLNMFFKCGNVEDGEEIFNHILKPDEILWTAMISGYAQHGQARKALDLFERMRSEGPHPTKVTYMSVLSACSRAGLVEEGLKHFLTMETEHGIEPSVQHVNCVSDMLAKSGRLDELEELIVSMMDEATIVTWTTLLDACKKQRDLERAARVAKHVLKKHPNRFLLSDIYI